MDDEERKRRYRGFKAEMRAAIQQMSGPWYVRLWEGWGGEIAIALGVLLVVGTLQAVTENRSVLKILTALFGLYGARLVICAFVVGLGIAAHKWKCWHQHSYGVIEVLFGVVAGVFISFSVTPGQPLFSRWVALVGCVYVIARGLNNIAEANAARLKARKRG